MSGFRPQSPSGGGMRRSTKVALVLLGTAGVAGVAMIWDGLQRDDDEEQARLAALAQQPVEAVNSTRTYSNNQYIPGVGYYHAPYFMWFPFPWNHRDPARGYFAGGNWHPGPQQSDILSSRPTAEAVAAATAAQRRREEEQRARASSFTSRPSSSPNRSTFRPSSTPSPSKSNSSVTRGGFGSSSRSGAS